LTIYSLKTDGYSGAGLYSRFLNPSDVSSCCSQDASRFYLNKSTYYIFDRRPRGGF